MPKQEQQIEQQARELLETEWEAAGYAHLPRECNIHDDDKTESDVALLDLVQASLRAITKALSTRPSMDGVESALRAFVSAWEALPGGRLYTAKQIDDWLATHMTPAINGAREALASLPIRSDGGSDDPPCTDCGGTGITYQTERRCDCQPPASRTYRDGVEELESYCHGIEMIAGRSRPLEIAALFNSANLSLRLDVPQGSGVPNADEMAILSRAIDRMGWPEIHAFHAELRRGQSIYEDAGGFMLRAIKRLFGVAPVDPVLTYQQAAKAMVAAAQGIETEGQDREDGLGAKHESPVREANAPKYDCERHKVIGVCHWCSQQWPKAESETSPSRTYRDGVEDAARLLLDRASSFRAAAKEQGKRPGPLAVGFEEAAKVVRSLVVQPSGSEK